MLLAATFIVLDQNVLRKPGCLAPSIERARRTGTQTLVLDVAVLEMLKHPTNREKTARLSFAGLGDFRDLVSVGRGVPDLDSELPSADADTRYKRHCELTPRS
jgi:hypothetical protein